MADRIFSDETAEVYVGNCLDEADVDAVMGTRKADALIFDAPYSKRTHSGHDSQHNEAADGGPRDNRARLKLGFAPSRSLLSYAAWTPAEVRAFCSLWLPRTHGWVVTITDHTLAPAWATSFERHGLLAFAPLPLIEVGSRVRMAGDGPSSWTCWLVVARPRGGAWATYGTLPGGYVVPRESSHTDRVVGGKPLLAMQCIVEDYSARGGLVVDPTSGGGTTLRAARALGRRCIGIEQSPERAALSVKAVQAVNIGQRELFECAEGG